MSKTARLSTRIKGFKRITYAVVEGGVPGAGKKLSDGKKIESSLEYEEEAEWAEDEEVEYSYEFSGGKGKVVVLGLTKEEYHDLFGNLLVEGGITITTTDRSNVVSFMWERKKKGGHRRLYVLYKCICSPIGLGSAESLDKGKGENEQTEIDFTISALTHDGLNRIGSFIDTDDPTADKEVISKWYDTPQFPATGGLETLKDLQKVM